MPSVRKRPNRAPTSGDGSEPALNGWRGGIGRRPCLDNPVNRKIRFVRRREGDPVGLNEQRDEGIGVQPMFMHVDTRLTDKGGSTRCGPIHCWRIRYGVDRGDRQQQAKNPDCA
jgi:hypothetical protein